MYENKFVCKEAGIIEKINIYFIMMFPTYISVISEHSFSTCRYFYLHLYVGNN